MEGLNNYLAEQHTPVATLTMAASFGGSQPDANTGQNMQQQGQNHGAGAQGQPTTTASASVSTSSAAVTMSVPANAVATHVSNPASRYISVMA
jgi:hypothetical protein